ncbi:hypothetical protein ACHAPJ_011270 [Fusarium lateritium]
MPVPSNNEIRAILDRITALEADVGELRTEVLHLRGEEARIGHSASQHVNSMTVHSHSKTPPSRAHITRTETGGFMGVGNQQTDHNPLKDEMMANPDTVGFMYKMEPVKKDSHATRTEAGGFSDKQTDLNAIRDEMMAADPDIVGVTFEVVPVKKEST